MNLTLLDFLQLLRKTRAMVLLFVIGVLLLSLWTLTHEQTTLRIATHDTNSPTLLFTNSARQLGNPMQPPGILVSSPRHLVSSAPKTMPAIAPTPTDSAHRSTPAQTRSISALYWLLLTSVGVLFAWLIHRRGAWKSWLAKLPRRRTAPAPTPTRKSPTDTQVLRHAYGELKDAFDKEEERMRQLVHLDALSRRLQRCASTAELAESVARCAQGIFPNAEGALYLHAEGDRFGLALAWGDAALVQTLGQLDCHALHSGQTYHSHSPGPMACAHARGEGAYVCLPLLVGSGLIGLLYLARLPQIGPRQMTPWAANAIAERAAIGLGALRRQEQWRLRAVRDGLTGLFNRGFMEESLGMELQRAQRQHSSVGIMLIDVDHFKRYNDTHGHAAGDTLLRGFGKLLQGAVREGDMACRYGGEEFVLIMPGADLAQTQQRAQALCKAIAQWQPKSDDGVDLQRVTASFGVACYPTHGDTWQAVMKRADEALYQAKDAGRNQVCAAPAQEMQAALL